jgi:hypothetical protein
MKKKNLFLFLVFALSIAAFATGCASDDNSVSTEVKGDSSASDEDASSSEGALADGQFA